VTQETVNEVPRTLVIRTSEIVALVEAVGPGSKPNP
jgi:hypothetical protein